MRGACVQRLTEIDDDDGFTCPLNYCYKFKTIMYVVHFFYIILLANDVESIETLSTLNKIIYLRGDCRS